MGEILTYGLFILGFVLLIKGADYLVDGSSSIAKKFNISDFIVGMTIVSFGTSMPELIVNIMASYEGSSELAIGNVIGSNISNILLILGISAVICPLPLHRNTVLSEIPFSLTSALLVGFLANAALFDDRENLTISRGDGIVLLFFFALFLAYIFRMGKDSQSPLVESDHEVEIVPMPKAILMISGGIVGLFLGGKWVVEGAIKIAEVFGFSQTFIGLTVVAIGTSLPELVTSVIAATKKNTDIAVGNVIGSNILNLLWILGISSITMPLPFDITTNTDIVVLIFASSLLLLAMATGTKNAIDRWDGIAFVFIYISYIGFLVYRG
ncbi:MAG: calcium/sodium antiporter [Bacteroidota bacterium]